MQALRWLIAYALIAPFALCCTVAAKLLVLNRLMDFSKTKVQGGVSCSCAMFEKVVFGVVVVGNVVGLIGNIVCSVFLSRAAHSYELAVAANSTALAKELYSKQEVQNGAKAMSIYLGFETTLLIFIVISFFVTGVAGVRRIRASLRAVDENQKNGVALAIAPAEREAGQRKPMLVALEHKSQKLTRQIVGTCGVVFVSFFVRAVYTCAFALASALQNNNVLCVPYVNRCGDCYNVFAHVQVWLLHTPELFFAVALISQPVALLVALWGMTSGQTLQIMRASDLENKS
jgi:hypothetical protein